MICRFPLPGRAGMGDLPGLPRDRSLPFVRRSGGFYRRTPPPVGGSSPGGVYDPALCWDGCFEEKGLDGTTGEATMYQYYKGVLIREGTEGVASRQLRELYEKTGWCSLGMPQWQNEKFTVALRNSAWAFTVWDKENTCGNGQGGFG